jgi:hypothetical protein
VIYGLLASPNNARVRSCEFGMQYLIICAANLDGLVNGPCHETHFCTSSDVQACEQSLLVRDTPVVQHDTFKFVNKQITCPRTSS